MAYINDTQQQYLADNDFGNYQFVSLKDIINQFMLIYVGEDKIIQKAKRLDVAFHAQRALAELSFDTFKSHKSQEIEVPATLQMILPQDYVNYTKISSVDDAGIQHRLYPVKDTLNPMLNPLQDSDGNFKLEAEGTIASGSDSITLTNRTENVLVGMAVTGLDIPDDTTVESVSHATSSTTITITNNATADATVILQFANTNGSLLTPENATHVVGDLDWTSGSNTITANSVFDISSLEIGMLVYHEDFPVGTKIANITTTTILLDQDATDDMAANEGQVVFVDPDKDTNTWSNYKSATPSENTIHDDYEDDIYWPNEGGRYGLEPSYAHVNGSFYIDLNNGKIHFSSNISGKTVVLEYISDGLGTEDEMKVHKFAEEAMYRSILHAVASGRIQTQQLVPRLKKEKFAAVRQAKLRLSNIKLEELTQILRGKSKSIKH